MSTASSDVSVRPAAVDDRGELCELLNRIIDIGGTTAYQRRLDETEFEQKFLSGAECICCHVAQASDGSLLGFQWLGRSELLADTWGSIATFARTDSQARGVGKRLFEATQAYARKVDVEFIDATIRADNVSGLNYYSRIGFTDYRVDPAVPLLDGTPVDRVSKVFRIVD